MAEREFVSMVGSQTRVLGRTYDPIRVDFSREHLGEELVRMARFNPEQLVVRTDRKAARLLSGYVDLHLATCNNGCRGIVSDEFKTY